MGDDLIANSFDTGISGIDWQNFRSYAYSYTETWDCTQDSQGNPSSGSMHLTVNLPVREHELPGLPGAGEQTRLAAGRERRRRPHQVVERRECPAGLHPPGGGEYKSFQESSTIDQDLVVRSAQCHALMPMMQFSVAPWRILDRAHLNAVRKAVKVRQQNTGRVLRLVRQSAVTGEPVVRSMEYLFPHRGHERVKDQFLLGDRLLVAPVLEKDASHRSVTLPPGEWKRHDGKRYKGPENVELSVAYDELCFFERVD